MKKAVKKVVKQKLLSRRTTWMLVSAGAAMLATTLVERGLDAGWRRALDEDDPPSENPLAQKNSWKKAVAYAALSGAVVGVTKVLATGAAAEGWRKKTGRAPSYE